MKLFLRPPAVVEVIRKYDLSLHDLVARSLYRSWLKYGVPTRTGLAISGGVDSMALARLCQDVTLRDGERSLMDPLWAIPEYHPRVRTSFTAFIVDHRIREGSGEEAMAVAAELAKMGIESEVLKLDWSSSGRPGTSTNLEAVARTLRYQAIAKACARHGIRALLTGHHSDDNAETVMLRILNGYLGAGLSGIKEVASVPECHGLYGIDHSGQELTLRTVGDKRRWNHEAIIHAEGGVRLARLMLGVPKSELIHLCRRRGVHWFEDRTNSDPTYTLRNTVRFLERSNVLPLALRTRRLSEMNKRVADRNKERIQEGEILLRGVPLPLDMKTGVLTMPMSPSLISNVNRTLSTSTVFLRRLIDHVSPKSEIELQAIAPVAGTLFEQLDGQSPKASLPSLQGAGVSINRKRVSDGEIWTLHRAIPSDAVAQATTLVMWPPPRDRWSEWQLWDGRYWIRVSPPPNGGADDLVICVRFLTKDDIAGLRAAISKTAARKLDASLALAKGNIRFTLPAIVSKNVAKAPYSAGEVVALPSLGWAVPEWSRFDGTQTNTSWCWDIRYRYVQSKAMLRMSWGTD